MPCPFFTAPRPGHNATALDSTGMNYDVAPMSKIDRHVEIMEKWESFAGPRDVGT